MHWGCFSWQGVGPIIPLEGSVNGASYVETLRMHALPTMHQMFSRGNGLFQHDNAAAHTSKVAAKFLEESGLRVLRWPAQSPDLNPIENLWAIVKYDLQKQKELPKNLAELERHVVRAWKAISKTTIRNLINSMPRRIQAVIAANGGPTKY
jgi:transposase